MTISKSWARLIATLIRFGVFRKPATVVAAMLRIHRLVLVALETVNDPDPYAQIGVLGQVEALGEPACLRSVWGDDGDTEALGSVG